MSKRLTSLFTAACLFGSVSFASAAPYYYVDWLAANPGAGTASGVITLPDLSTVNIGFKAVNSDGSAGSFYFAQTSGGTDFWNPSTPYTSSQVDNRPPDTDIVALIGGQNQTYEVTLSEPIKDPIMAILSLGNPNLYTSYDFDSPFTIVSQGTGYWGGNGSSLQQLPGDILLGNEGHGTIQFIGTFANFSWTVPTPEGWHGFTFGIRTTPRIEPDPDPTPVPEPASLVLLSMGAAGLVLAGRRRAGR